MNLSKIDVQLTNKEASLCGIYFSLFPSEKIKYNKNNKFKQTNREKKNIQLKYTSMLSTKGLYPPSFLNVHGPKKLMIGRQNLDVATAINHPTSGKFKYQLRS